MNSLPNYNIIDDVLAGQVVILPQYLQQINQFEPLTQIVIRAINDKCGHHIRKHVKKVGIEYIHEVLTPKQLMDVYKRTSNKLKSYLPKVMVQIAESLNVPHPFYIHNHSIARFIVPVDYLDDTFKGRLGRLYPYEGAHQDSSQQVPENAINFWIAIGQIKRIMG